MVEAAGEVPLYDCPFGLLHAVYEDLLVFASFCEGFYLGAGQLVAEQLLLLEACAESAGFSQLVGGVCLH